MTDCRRLRRLPPIFLPGLYGSRGYVKEHFGDPVTMAIEPEHAKLAAYFHVDNGTGKIRDVCLPAFPFIQDPLDYGSRTHHSNLDVYDHIVPADLMQASAVLASFVYNAATRA